MAEEGTKRDKTNAKRRQHILNSAVAGFIENGFHQTGVRDIARRAEISLGNLYNHFSGKNAVLAGIAEQERAELDPLLRILEHDGPPTDVLEDFITNYVDYLASPEMVILTLEITCEAIRNQDIAHLFTDSRNTLVEAIAKQIAKAVEPGKALSSAETKETAHLVLAAIESSAYRIAIEQTNPALVLSTLKAFVSAALGSVGGKRGD